MRRKSSTRKQKVWPSLPGSRNTYCHVGCWWADCLWRWCILRASEQKYEVNGLCLLFLPHTLWDKKGAHRDTVHLLKWNNLTHWLHFYSSHITKILTRYAFIPGVFIVTLQATGRSLRWSYCFSSPSLPRVATQAAIKRRNCLTRKSVLPVSRQNTWYMLRHVYHRLGLVSQLVPRERNSLAGDTRGSQERTSCSEVVGPAGAPERLLGEWTRGPRRMQCVTPCLT